MALLSARMGQIWRTKVSSSHPAGHLRLRRQPTAAAYWYTRGQQVGDNLCHKPIADGIWESERSALGLSATDRRWRDHKKRGQAWGEVILLELKQGAFAMEATPISSEAAVGTDHSMARNDDADGVVSVGQPHRPRGSGPADLACDLPIRRGLSIGDIEQGSPDSPLERGSLESEGDVELGELAIEVGLELVDGVGECHWTVAPAVLVGWRVRLVGHSQIGDRLAVTSHRERADRAVHGATEGDAHGCPFGGHWLIGWSSAAHRYCTA